MGGKSQFSKGMEVEVCSDDQGLRGAWFVAKILQSIPRKKKALIQYQTLISETSKPLKEFVDLINLRPIAPRETNFNFDFSDEVDAYHNDGWWEGIVTRVLVKENSSSRYLVYFRNGKEEIEFGEDELRVHREWVHGNWIPPMETASVEEEKARGNEEGESGVVVIEDVDDLQPQEKLRMDGDHTQIGIRSDKTQLPLVSNINDLVRTIPVHEATITEGSGSCGNFVASRCESSNLDHFSCSNLTADIAHEFDTLEEATKQPTTEISSPCEKLNEVEMTEGSPVIIAEAEHVIPSTPTPEGEETSLQNKKEATQNMSDIISSPGEKLNEVEMMLGSPVLISQVEQAMSFTPTPGEETSLQNKKEITQNMSDIISGPSEQLNDHLAPSSSQENTGTVTDCDISGCRSRIVTTPPINNERLCNSSETQLQCLEQNHNVHLPADEQQCLDAGWLCLEASVDSKEHPENLSLPEPKVDKEKKKRRPSQQCSNNLLEERKKRPSQQCPKLPEPFIPSDEQQRCRRTGKGWRCSTMAFPRKRYCEKHEIEQNVRNQKRRKRPIEETHVMMEPFQPTDPPQQCRRSGKGWRCRAMASSGKRYCDKHQLEQNVHNEKKRQKRKLREEPCLAVEMDIDGRPNQGDTENIGPENVSQIGNTVDCIVNMQCEVERSALSDVAVSSENNEVDAARDDQSDASELIQWKAGGSDEVHALQVGHNTSVGFSNETETKKRMTGAFSDEFWPVFIT